MVSSLPLYRLKFCIYFLPLPCVLSASKRLHKSRTKIIHAVIRIILYLLLTCFIATYQKKWSCVNDSEGSLSMNTEDTHFTGSNCTLLTSYIWPQVSLCTGMLRCASQHLTTHWCKPEPEHIVLCGKHINKSVLWPQKEVPCIEPILHILPHSCTSVHMNVSSDNHIITFTSNRQLGCKGMQQ